MREDTGNIWTYPADAVVITTNGFVKKNGEAVMGRGCAKEASIKMPWLPTSLGLSIKRNGNIVESFGFRKEINKNLMIMPVKHNWWEKADIDLIKSSSFGLMYIANIYKYNKIVMPRPGCGNGQLDWEDVKPLLEKILDDRFVAITFSV